MLNVKNILSDLTKKTYLTRQKTYDIKAFID